MDLIYNREVDTPEGAQRIDIKLLHPEVQALIKQKTVDAEIVTAWVHTKPGGITFIYVKTDSMGSDRLSINNP